MSNFFKTLLIGYDQEKFYYKKKAEYTFQFVGLLLIYLMFSIFISQLFNDHGYSDVLQSLLFTMALMLVAMLVYFRKIEWAINLLIIAGMARGLVLIREPIALHFNTHIFIMLVVTAAVHVEKYQLFFIFSLFNGTLIGRLVYAGYMSYLGKMDSVSMPEFVYTLFGGTALTIGVLFLIQIIDKEINNSEMLERASETDTLTKLPNRRRFESMFVKKFTGYEKCVLLLDLDHFKSVNDTFGHHEGDRVLIQVAEILYDSIRSSDAVFRWGGEEFVIMLRGISEELGCSVAERIRHTIENHNFGIEQKITISIGMLHIGTGASVELLSNYLRRADRALYRAKADGRNRVVLDHKFKLLPVESTD